jgi:hypothetical protein
MTSLLNRAPGTRPKARALIRLDLYNAYARLGVSPLLTTDEIKAAVQRKRKELMRQRRARSQQQFGAEEAEITALQAIEEEIGTPRARARYDQAHPQNELLTVQPSPHDRWLDPRHRSALVTGWLVEELGRAALLPSPEALAFWAPKGLDPEVAAFLAEFATADGGPAPPTLGLALPEVADLERLSAPTAAPSTPDLTEESPHG